MLIARSIIYEYTPEELQKLLDISNGYLDVLRKIQINSKGRNVDTLKRIIKEYNLDETQLNINRHNLYSKCAKNAHEKTKIILEDALQNKYPKVQATKLLQLLVEKNIKKYKCEICGITDWQNKPLTFHLHHIDGNHNNNQLDNLQVLCPNCHSQTSNYSGKKSEEEKRKRKANLKKNKEIIRKLPPISRERLKNLIRNISFVKIAKEFNVTDNAVRKWCDKYKLPRKVSDIKKISDNDWEQI